MFSKDGDKNEKLTPLDAIAEMMLGLSYREMCSFADQIEDKQKANPNTAMSDLVDGWAQEQRGLRASRGKDVKAEILNLKPGPLPGQEKGGPPAA